jgi:hypothetical protein
VLAKKRWLFLLMAALALGAGAAKGAVSLSTPPALVKAARPAKPMHRRAHVDRRLLVHYVSVTRRWQGVMGVRRATPPVRATIRDLRAWRRLAARTYLSYLHPPHKSGWLCIHHFEGSWSDAGDPYWGGLQMDRGFMSTYGEDMIARHHGGLADTWTPAEQIVVAERAYRTRGFAPWPNTARSCGVL